MSRARGALVACEIALAVMLLTGAGLLLEEPRGAWGRLPWAIDPRTSSSCRRPGCVPLRRATRSSPRSCRDCVGSPASWRRAPPRSRLANLSRSGSGVHTVDRKPETRDSTREQRTLFNIAAPGTFAALGIPIRVGRAFEASDTADRPLVAIVNEALVAGVVRRRRPPRPDHLLSVRPGRRYDHRRGRRRYAPAQPRRPPGAGVLHALHAARLQRQHPPRRHPHRERPHGAGRRRAAAGGRGLPRGSGLVHDHAGDARDHGGGADVSHAPVRPVRGSGPLPGRGGRLRRDGGQRPAAFEERSD